MSIKSFTITLATFAAAGLSSANSYAATIIDQDTGLTSPDKIVIEFGNDLSKVGTVIGSQFDGVTFGSTYVYNHTTATHDALTHGYLENLNSNTQPGSILFDTDVSTVNFSWRARTSTTFSAWNDDVKVEEFVADTNMSLSGGRYYGFQDIVFDEIRLSIQHPSKAFTLDNLEYISVIPIPAALWLFGSGLLGLIGLARRHK
jgi:hypothetical protein